MFFDYNMYEIQWKLSIRRFVMKAKDKRESGTGSIYWYEARKKYVASFYNPFGKRVSKSFKTREEASEFLDMQLSSIENKLYVDIPSDNITLAEWITDYLITYKKPYVSLQTYQAYVSATVRLKPILHLRLKCTANIYPIQKFFNDKIHDYSFSTINLMKTVLFQSVRKAYDLHMIPENYTEKLEIHPLRNRKKHHMVKVFSVEQLNLLRNGLFYYYEHRRRGMEHYVIFMIALYTGLRIGEILALQWKDIDLDKELLSVSKTLITLRDKSSIQECPKTESSYRTVRIPKVLSDLLKDYKAYCHSLTNDKILYFNSLDNDFSKSFLFSNYQGDYFPYASVRIMFSRLCKRFHIIDYTFHSLRHTFASYLLANGVPVTTVSHVLGHRSPAVTLSIYLHFVPQADSVVASTASFMYEKDLDEVSHSLSAR